MITAGNVIISSGSLRSPALLMRSGIGDPAALRAAGIPVRVESRGVGQNLMDHPVVVMAAVLRRRAVQPASLRPAANMAFRLSSGIGDTPAHDIYTAAVNKTSWHALGRRLGALVCCLYKPYSRGSVMLDPENPHAAPVVHGNLLSESVDMERMKWATRFAMGLLADPAMGAVLKDAFPASFSERVRELNQESRSNRIKAWFASLALDGPSGMRRNLIDGKFSEGVAFNDLANDDSALEYWIRQRATGFFHPAGTCRMGPFEDADAVVDPAGRVHGISNLRVCDASLMPWITSANTNIPTIMIAEKIAQAILDES